MLWKKIKKIPFKDTNSSIATLKKNKFKLSPWIENIFRINIVYKFNLPILVYRIKVKNLGFTKATTLEKIY